MAAPTVEQPYNISPSAFIKQIANLNGVDYPELIDKFSKKGESGKIREFVIRSLFEHSSPTTQCAEFISKCPSKSPSDSQACRCWICGEEITIRDGTHKLGPECEHKIPVMAANLILGGLYTPELKNVATKRLDRDNSGRAEEDNSGRAEEDNSGRAEEDIYTGSDLDIIFSRATMQKLKSEYAWAHKICNGAKKDKLYIKNNGHFDDDKIIETLRLIKSNDTIKKTFISTGKNTWIAQRVVSMKKDLENIQQEIRRQYLTGSNLSLLANTASVIHNLMNDQKHPDVIDELMKPSIANITPIAVKANIITPSKDNLQKYAREIPKGIVNVHKVITEKAMKKTLSPNNADDINELFLNNDIQHEYNRKIEDFIQNFIRTLDNEKDQELRAIFASSQVDIFYLKYYLASINEVIKWTTTQNPARRSIRSGKNDYKLSFLRAFNTIPGGVVINPNYDYYKNLFFTPEEIKILDNFKRSQLGGKKRKQNKYKKKIKKSKKNINKKNINKKNSKKINKNKSKKKHKKNNINTRKSIKK